MIFKINQYRKNLKNLKFEKMTPQILVFNDNDESIIFLKCLILKFVIIFKKILHYIKKNQARHT